MRPTLAEILNMYVVLDIMKCLMFSKHCCLSTVGTMVNASSMSSEFRDPVGYGTVWLVTAAGSFSGRWQQISQEFQSGNVCKFELWGVRF